MYSGDIMTVNVNLVGLPALIVPCGFVEGGPAGLPVGLQLIGSPFSALRKIIMGTTTPSFCPSCCADLVSQHPSETVSRCVMDKSDGRHRFVITDYWLTKSIGPGNKVTSPPFSVGGHDWAINCYPGGDKPENREFISLFLSLESNSVGTASGVRVMFTLAMLDNEGRPSPPYRDGPITLSSHVSRWGNERFITRALLELTPYVAGDRLVIQCEVSVLQPPRSEDVPKIGFTTGPLAPPPPYELHRHLGRLLDSGEGADVTFQVGEELFPAHRCVLAARSPVFRAELFGSMEEARVQLIKIKDVEPAVFDALLRFIYTETLPPPMLEKLTNAKEGPASSTVTARLLFAAADRYHVDRLKLICQETLCRDMNVDNVAGTFEFADRHHCSSLKSACFKFITASPETLLAVVKLHGWMPFLQDETLKLIN